VFLIQHGSVSRERKIKENEGNMTKNYLVWVLCFLLAACASTTKLTGKNEADIRAISFDSTVKVPPKAYYHGPAQSAGAAFGVIGVLLTEAIKTNDQLITDYMKNNGIDIGSIVLEEFQSQVKKHPKFLDKKFTTAAADADARFEVEVKIYGISQTHGFSSEYRPILGVTGRLMSAKGEKLWERYDYLTARNDSLPGRSFEEYLEDPRNMREAYEKMSEGVVSLLMENL
jgi:hypothetical protein